MDLRNNIKYMAQIENIAKSLPLRDCTMLVTGATGLIGTCLVDTILLSNQCYNSNIQLVLLGRDLERMRKKFNYSYSGKPIVYMEKDLSIASNIDDISGTVDYILHLASLADPRSYTEYPVETIRTNINGTQSLLEYCKNNRSTRMLLASSFEVYGKIEHKEIFNEADSGEIDLNSIRSCYPESKRCSEIMMRAYHEEYKVDCVIARLCSIYGPTMKNDDSKAHAEFIKAALNKNSIIMKSQGLQKRSYCYVVDAISALFCILLRGISGEVYNVSNEKSITSIANLAKVVSQLCGTRIIVQENDENRANIHYSRPQDCILDNTKLKDLGWDGKFTLKNGIESMMDIMKG